MKLSDLFVTSPKAVLHCDRLLLDVSKLKEQPEKLVYEDLKSDWHWKWLFLRRVKLELHSEWLFTDKSSFKLQEVRLSEMEVKETLHEF